MRAEHTNEVEERRVIRMLARLAEDVPALPDHEIQRAVAAVPARAMPRRGRSLRPARCFSAVAAAAVIALAFVVHFEASAGRASSVDSRSASAGAFPEGSALQLLLSASRTSR